MMEIPWFCGNCGHENMVDLENLSEWPLDKIVTAQGFTCSKCESREAISHRTTSLIEAERKLSRYHPGQEQFQHHFWKILHKLEGLNARGVNNGAFKRQNLAFPGSMG